MEITLSETNIWRSIKKFWYDQLDGVVSIFFDRVITKSQKADLSQWVTIFIEGVIPGHVSDASMTIYMFSTQDSEGDNLAELRDTIFDLLTPGYIDFYDTSTVPWVKAGAFLVYIRNESRIFYNPDRTKMKYLTCDLKWPSIWS